MVITDQEKFDERRKEVEDKKNVFSNYKLKQSYVLNYYFPREIKSISNEKAVISADRKSLSLEFQLSDCLQNPELTNFEVILE